VKLPGSGKAAPAFRRPPCGWRRFSEARPSLPPHRFRNGDGFSAGGDYRTEARPASAMVSLGNGIAGDQQHERHSGHQEAA
jgi:hypothetical protein